MELLTLLSRQGQWADRGPSRRACHEFRSSYYCWRSDMISWSTSLEKQYLSRRKNWFPSYLSNRELPADFPMSVGRDRLSGIVSQRINTFIKPLRTKEPDSMMTVETDFNSPESIPAKFCYFTGGLTLACLCMGLASNGFVMIAYLK